MKPDNILVTKTGVAKLTDMGLVKDVEGDLNLTKTGRGLGTPHFMAPEQFRNAKTVDVRGDIYSLGATLYAMVTGLVPFENASPLDCWMKKIRNEFPPPKELNPILSDRVDWAIRRAMSAEPDRRPASCREFLEDLTGQSRSTPTRLGDLTGSAPALPPIDVWYMVYKDETGTTHTVKGSTEGIRNALAGHLLGDAGVDPGQPHEDRALSARSPACPEFRDLVVHPAQLPAPAAARLSGVLAKASGVAPLPSERRRPADPDSVDVGALPSGPGGSSMHRRQPTPPRSDRFSLPADAKRTTVPTGPSNHTPSPLDPVTLTVEQPADSRAETEPFAEAIDSKTELAESSAPARDESISASFPASHQPFNWTPILLAVVMILTMTVVYLLIKR